MHRFVLGAIAALVLLAGQASAATFVPISTGGVPQQPTPANIVALVQSLFPNETVTFLAKRNVGGANEKGEGTIDLTFEPAGQLKAGTWTYTPDAGKTLLPNVIVLKAATGAASVGVYAANPLSHVASMGNFNTADFPLLTPNGKNIADLSSLSALHVTPLPAAVWMMGAGLAGLAGWRRARRAAA